MDNDIKIMPILDPVPASPNILIHKNKSAVCINANIYEGEAEVFLEFLPRPSIYVYGSYNDVPTVDILQAASNPSIVTHLSINSTTVNGFAISCGGDINSNVSRLKWCPEMEPIGVIGNDLTQFKRVIFHLYNFKEFRGTRISIEGGETFARQINHIDMIYENLKIEIKSLVETEDNIKKIKSEGTSCLTHVGEFQNIDGMDFNGKEASEILTELASFFSFSRGKRCNPIFAVGFNSANARVWESWSSPVQQEDVPFSWFDPDHGSQLANFFPKFHERWKDEDWRRTLRESIFWYLSANIPSRDLAAGIILTQAAIERLSFQFSVEDKKLLTRDAFKDLRGADKFRILFASLGLPLDIPSATPKLQKKGISLKWGNSPYALTVIRNSLVHPEHKSRGKFDDLIFEAWKLSLWYLELSILAICNYDGTYANRLTQTSAGQVEDVPWKK